ncbi:TonB-dependent receptor plug domain-containing protein [Hymenobacter lutimineralis]|uniref:TonB-dependent receptor plug domain-containing protein n=1 Tax=Hymenobacter lutimineralis TaxID=2606448 RepID=A0A5D6VE00_9BACT|nr:TonB-dependent receptor [Hymenobacter lutimineralis]TYZ14173.1 TonB-dependent receptor plug domain-containing protein [Hymenobacter lutimineralis]
MQHKYAPLLVAALLQAGPLAAAPAGGEKPQHATRRKAAAAKAVKADPSEANVAGVIQLANGEPLPGATVFIKGTFIGTSTDQFGKFSLLATFDGAPVELVVAYVGYETQTLQVSQANTALSVQMVRSATLLNETVVAASRVEESILRAPVTIDKVSERQIERISTPEVLGGLGNLPGVDVNSSSMLFTSVSTRGFNTAKSERVVQLVDYMDTALPSLNLSPGNLVGIPELDMESIEIIHGPASALYGSNALSGVILFNSKDPFVYDGLSVRLRAGQRNLLDGQLRYAQKLGKRFAFKINASAFRADEWIPENYNANAGSQNPTGSVLGIDAINRYGELNNTFSPVQDVPALGFKVHPELYGKTVYMPGYTERELLAGDTKTDSRRLQAAVTYLLRDDLKLTVEAKRAIGSATYQNISRFRVKDLGTNQFRAELKSARGFLRAYSTQDFTGDTYELTQLSGLILKSPSAAIPQLSNRDFYFVTYNNTYDAERGKGRSIDEALVLAKQAADATQPAVSSERFATLRQQIINEDQPGVGSKQNFSSYLNDVSGQRTFKLGEEGPELTLGAAYRQYLLGSNGKLFNDFDGKRIRNHEYGTYGQLTHTLLDDHLKLSVAARVDAFKNFKTAVSPRAAAVYTLGENKQHNFRASYGRAFRSPSQTDQFLYSDVSDYVFRGNSENGFKGYLFTDANGRNYVPFSGMDLTPFKVSFDKLRLEQVGTAEVGYKGVVLPNLYLDASYFRSTYKDFIGVSYLVSRPDGSEPTPAEFDAGYLSAFRATSASAPRIISLARNNAQPVRTQGATVGLTYYLSKAVNLTGNYSLNVLDRSNLPAGFRTFFNTPKHKYNLGVNGVVLKSLSYSVNYRWVQGHQQELPFATGMIKDYSTTDAYAGYMVPKLGTTFQLGASNLFNTNNLQVIGAPNLGRLVYVGIMVDVK